jgi:hypothetical protein
MHIRVIDTEEKPTLLNIYANYEALFQKALTRVSGAQGKLFDEKQMSKISPRPSKSVRTGTPFRKMHKLKSWKYFLRKKNLFVQKHYHRLFSSKNYCMFTVVGSQS